MREVIIYGLVDPRDNRVRYVGQTIDLKNRIVCHYKNKEKTHKYYWLMQLKSLGLEADVIILEKCNEENFSEREKYWIAYYRSIYEDLTNLTDGGDKPIFSEESRRKMSLSKKGKPKSEEWKRYMSEKYLREGSPSSGKPVSDATKKLLSLKLKGRKDRDEVRIKKSLAKAGKKLNIDKTSRYSGVNYDVNKNRWISRIRIGIDKRIYIGGYKTEIEAAQAYNNYILDHNLPLELNTFDLDNLFTPI